MKLARYYNSTLPLIKRHLRTTAPFLSFSRIFNILYSKYEEITHKTVCKSKPYFIKLEPTNRCNLRCKGCLLHSTKPNRVNQVVKLGEMDFNLFKNIIDQLADSLVKVSLYSLGEPFVYSKIADMIKYLSDRKIGTVASSNLNYLPESLAHDLVKNKLTHLIVSLDGADKEVYNQFRIGGNFDQVIKNIELIQAEKKKQNSKYPLIEIQTIKFPHIGKKEVQDMKKLCRELKVDRFSLKEDSSPYYEAIKPAQKTCFWLYGLPMIKWDGIVQPCCYFYEYANNDFGDLNQNTVMKVYNNEKYKAAREYFKTGKKTGDLKCYNCIFFKK